ncbi:MAG: thioredoxin-dependent thiol peroxidase [Prevotellaceae bacterium]|jgi:peroxiredoxin Q/BCP|nr:thioredoxin-dependent thiol peroxidase [Prevotellaceae bacterium]
MTTLKQGDKAPDFIAKNQDGEEIRLSDYKGRKLALYFYPKDNTSGCTAEACSLRNSHANLQAAGYEVLGVSPDSEKSHTSFIVKYSLPFPLIADTDKALAQAYGVWGEKKMCGRAYFGIIRTTFIIDKNGIIEDVISKVDVKNAGEQILAKLA